MTIPKPIEFLLGTPLYAKIPYEGEEVWDVLNILYFYGTYDSYCTKCQRESTFQVVSKDRPSQFIRNAALERLQQQSGLKPDLPTLDGVFRIQAKCTRAGHHTQDFLCFAELKVISNDTGAATVHRTIEKIGQQPSYGDLHIAQVKKYKHVLSAAQLGEFTRAIGLASHDVGVGAYVYLRRIFEMLVDDAHQAAVADAGWDEDEYQRSRMSERISLLRAHLPTFLVEHPSMYSLLSRGIHELSEEDCLKHFDTLRIGIELILDERLEQRERKHKIAAATAAINKAVGEVGA